MNEEARMKLTGMMDRNHSVSCFFLKCTIASLLLMLLCFSSFLFDSVAEAIMEDYCVVPPYVIQDVPPDIMMLVDNSGSMYNFAYTCMETETSQNSPNAGFVNQPVYVKNVTGFAVGDEIMVWDSLHGAGTDYWRGDPADGNGGIMKIISIDKTANSFSVVTSSGVPAGLHYNAKQPVVKQSCMTLSSLLSVDHYDSSYISNKDYYGYFNPEWYYTYGSSKFTPSRKKSVGAKAAAEWDGNFLNWLTMRRVDVLRKVLTGGRSSSNRLSPEKADVNSRGNVKMVVGNTEAYAPSTYTGTRCFEVPTGSGGSTFEIRTAAGICTVDSSGNMTGASTSFTLSIVTNDPIEGVLQSLAGTRARLGLTFYNTDEGGKVARDIRGNNCGGQCSSLPCVVNDINNTSPTSNTPIAEALWTVTGYFAGVTSLEGG
ncbi:MAG: hypothetical protein E4H16_01705, partial [Candidatus Atribacteria bacterium]